MSQPIGVLGGTFDPIHEGHLAVADAACAVLGLSTVRVIPTHHPPHRQRDPHASGYHRFAMVAIAVLPRAHHPMFVASDRELLAPDRSYTSVTLRRLHEEGLRACDLFFMTGADAFAEIASWRDYPAILDLAHFAVVSRPGHSAAALANVLPDLRPRMITARPEGADPEIVFRRVSDAERCRVAHQADPAVWLVDVPALATPDVSSTEIRRRLAAGDSIAGMVPPRVEEYIRRHHLYGA